MTGDEQDDNETLRSTLHRVLGIGDEEKRAAALMLHDDVAQSLTVLSLQLSVMRKQQAANPVAVANTIPDLLQIITATQEKVRELEFTLYPKVVELSITEAVKGLMRRLAKDHGHAIEYVCPPAITCGRKVAIGLYRMVEGFFARSRARQSAAWRVTLGESAEGIALSIVQTSPPEVSDPAVVMDPLTREYIRAYGGRYRIATDPTRIDVVFPVA